jgi:glycosyltransferase involved in cell wall biosynthesis
VLPPKLTDTSDALHRPDAPLLVYVANVRVPTEKAHGLQIVQNCEALAALQPAAPRVVLWAAARVQARALRRADVFAHYGVARVFALRRLPTLDLLAWAGEGGRAARAAFALQLGTYLLSLCGALLLAERGAAFYSRDERIIAVVRALRPRARIGYEPHQHARGRVGRFFQRRAVRAADAVFPVTGGLADDLAPLHPGGRAAFTVLHDGIRPERFAALPTQEAARAALGWPAERFIVGYMGRLSTMAQDKGVGTLIDAIARARAGGRRVALAIVGGPDAHAESLRKAWAAHGLPAEDFLYAGQVSPDRVPAHLAAFSACAMPLPDTPHFARHASPLKLFEYMASGRPVLASDLPGFREVVADGEHALMLPPGDPAAWAAAIARLHDSPALCARLAAAAHTLVMTRYTWAARARHIADALFAR